MVSSLALVVANVEPGARATAGCRAALARELASGDEVLWVDAPTVPPGAQPVAGVVLRARGSSRGELYRTGFDASRWEVVAFTDSTTVLLDGWRSAALEGVARHGAVGGPVAPPPGRRGSVATAGFLLEYGVHAVAPYTSATHDVSANNVAFDRALLASVLAPGEPLWKSEVSRRLADRAPKVTTTMRVRCDKHYRPRDLGPTRLAHGRLYGAQRRAGLAPARRVARAAACALVPALSYGRLASRLLRDPGTRWSLVAATPPVVVGLVSWSLGEAIGLVAGEGAVVDVF